MSDKHAAAHPANADDDDVLAERREVFAALDRFIVRVYGDRCDKVAGGCTCCAVWASRDALNAIIFE